MAKVRLDLKDETFERLAEAAVRERRPVDWQAEVLIERALGVRPHEGDLSAGDSPSRLLPIEKHAEEAECVPA